MRMGKLLSSLTKPELELIIKNANFTDDEQKIFDSVNSLGKSLTNSDIIKNYIFQKLTKPKGIKLFFSSILFLT